MGSGALTNTVRRRRVGVSLAGLVLVAACSSGSTDGSGADDTDSGSAIRSSTR